MPGQGRQLVVSMRPGTVPSFLLFRRTELFELPSTMAAAAGTAGEHRRGLDCLSEVLDDKHVAQVLREHLQFPHKASPALGYAGGSKFAAGALFVKLSTGPTSLFEGGPGLLGKVLAKEQAVGKFLLENLRSTNVVVPMSRRADVFVFDPGPMPIHWTSRDWVGRVVSARALVSTRYDLGDHSICVGSSDALQTFHLCAGFHPLAELIAATMGLSYGVVKLKGEGPVTLHKFETLVYKRDERLPKDAGMSDRDCALLLGMDKGESEVSKVCKELEQRYSVILDPLTQFRGRRVDDAMAVSRLPAPWATDPPGSIGSSLPFDVEMHVLPTGQACVVDVSRLAVPEARRAGPWITAVTLVGRRAGRAFAETARVASLDLSGAQGLSEFELSVDHPFFWLTSRAARPAALNAVSAALSGDHTTLAQRLRRAACEGAASVTVDASTGVAAVSCDESPGAGSDVMVALVSFPSLYWQSPQLSCLFGVEAGRFLKSRGLAVSPDEWTSSREAPKLCEAAGVLLGEANVALADGHVREALCASAAGGVHAPAPIEALLDLRQRVKRGLHKVHLGLRHVGALACSLRKTEDTRRALAAACLPKPKSASSLALLSLASTTARLCGIGGRGSDLEGVVLASAVAARALAVKGRCLSAEGYDALRSVLAPESEVNQEQASTWAGAQWQSMLEAAASVAARAESGGLGQATPDPASGCPPEACRRDDAPRARGLRPSNSGEPAACSGRMRTDCHGPEGAHGNTAGGTATSDRACVSPLAVSRPSSTAAASPQAQSALVTASEAAARGGSSVGANRPVSLPGSGLPARSCRDGLRSQRAVQLQPVVASAEAPITSAGAGGPAALSDVGAVQECARPLEAAGPADGCTAQAERGAHVCVELGPVVGKDVYRHALLPFAVPGHDMPTPLDEPQFFQDLLFAQQHEGRMSGEARVLLSLQRMRHVSFSAELREIVRLRFVTLASILHAIGGQHAGTLSNPNLVDGVTCYEFRAEALGSTEEPTGPSPAPAPAPVPAAPAVERYTCLTTPANPGAVAAYSAAKSASEDS